MYENALGSFKVRLHNSQNTDVLDLRLGTKCWIIAREKHRVYKPCSVCGGKKSLTVNDYSFTCPKCKGKSSGELWYETTRFRLKECQIDRISFCYETNTSPNAVFLYDDQEQPKLDLRISLYQLSDCRVNFNFNFNNVRLALLLDSKDDRVENRILSENSYFLIDRYVFWDKKEAVKAQRYLNSFEKERVSKYYETGEENQSPKQEC